MVHEKLLFLACRALNFGYVLAMWNRRPAKRWQINYI